MQPKLVINLVFWWFLCEASCGWSEEKPIRVLVWDERQPQQMEAYDGGFLGDAIAAHLSKQPGFKVKSVGLDSPEQGLDASSVKEADVLIWWGHQKHNAIPDERVQAITQRVIAGELGFIALHSAHWAKPFVELMNARAKADAFHSLPEAERATAKIEFLTPKRGVPKKDDPLTPRLEKAGEGWKLTLPLCVFPSWRADGAPGHVTTLLPKHPIASGLPEKWNVEHTEMYSEPFHIPAPDAVVFEERWDKGEHFRSGCIWQVGQGRVFYFRPGHETYPVYKQAECLRVIENATKWAAQQVEK